MNMEMLLRYDAPVPRYTSYPTAPHFHAGVDAETYGEWLGRLGDGDTLSLYLHVPFCAEMCWYCGCHTKVVRQYRPVGEYARALEREVALVAAPGSRCAMSIGAAARPTCCRRPTSPG